jgi:hypothetical protein
LQVGFYGRIVSATRREALMTRKLLVFVIATFAMAGVASAQEVVGAEHIEVGAGVFGLGGLFMKAATPTEPSFNKYVFCGSVTFNVSSRVGLETDLALTLGERQASTQSLSTQATTPNLFSYSENVVYNPIGRDRRVVPYVVGGVGAWTLFDTAGAADLGLTGPHTYLTSDLGGGARWFFVRHWGIRMDYRHILMKNDTSVPFFGPESLRHANRVYAALELTF